MTEDPNQGGSYYLPIEGLKAWDSKPLLEKITGLVPSIIYIFNQQTQSNEYTNRGIGEALGYSSIEVAEMGDMLIPSLCHKDDLENVIEHFQAIKAMNDGDILTVEYRMKHHNGSWVWLLSHDTVFERDESGDVLRHIGTATDITEQKEAQNKAVAVTRELRNFAYSVSHDLNSPANTLAMLIAEIQQTHSAELDSDGLQLLDFASQTIERMQNLIVDVSTYTNVVNATATFQRLNLGDNIQNVINDLKFEINESTAKITLAELPDIMGNPTQIRQLFQNLIVNALKYRRADIAPKISITDCSTSKAHGANISISVADNGIGIPVSNYQRIFDIFSRFHSDNEYASSSGLGLAICKRIAVTHDAEIFVESVVGEGATFTVSFKGIR